MRRFLAFLWLAAVLAVAGPPAHAFPLGQRAPILTPGACANVTVRVDFIANGGGGLYCLNGARYPTFVSIPGAAFSRASTKTALNSAGQVLSFASGVPAITDLGFLYEEARTNVIFPSTPATLPGGSNAWNPDWNGHASTIAANDRVAPNGAVVASKITTAFATEGLYYRTTTIPAANAQWAFSVWVYSLTPVTVTSITGGSGGNAWVGGTFVTGTTNVPANTWTRCTLLVTALATPTATSVTYAVTVPLSGASFWVWNAQAEAGATATSDILTTAAAATRAADAAELTGVALPNGGTTWTLYGQAYLPTYVGNSVYQGMVGVDNGAISSNQITLFASNGGRARAQMNSGGAGTYDSSNSLPIIVNPGLVRIAASYQAGQITAEAQGSILAPVTALGPVGTSRLVLGVLNGTSQPSNGYIQRAALYARAIVGLTQ